MAYLLGLDYLSCFPFKSHKFSYQLSAISYQLSAISYQLSAISYQLSAIKKLYNKNIRSSYCFRF
ncbi:hypothetical protein B1F84_02355 [Pseudoalteromonas sp. DL-6]|nr:hypothetical protein B1F84_02355 [Pseudoalteromonas sp. DL-6]